MKLRLSFIDLASLMLKSCPNVIRYHFRLPPAQAPWHMGFFSGNGFNADGGEAKIRAASCRCKPLTKGWAHSVNLSNRFQRVEPEGGRRAHVASLIMYVVLLKLIMDEVSAKHKTSLLLCKAWQAISGLVVLHAERTKTFGGIQPMWRNVLAVHSKVIDLAVRVSSYYS